MLKPLSSVVFKIVKELVGLGAPIPNFPSFPIVTRFVSPVKKLMGALPPFPIFKLDTGAPFVVRIYAASDFDSPLKVPEAPVP